jgi:hypothetical protein
MLPSGVWGFLTALLIVLVGAYLLFPDLNWRLPGESASTPLTTLLCAGGSGASCCGQDHHEHTSALAITIDRLHNKVNVFLEGEGSANGAIIEDEESHLLFGKKSCDDPPPASRGTSAGVSTGTSASAGAGEGTSTDALQRKACKFASGEINRLTGAADIRIKDGNGQTVAEWSQIQCGRKGRKF